MPKNAPTTLPDLHGRLAVVTGASDGMGAVIATRLAAAGAQLILPVRDPAKGTATVRAIAEHVPSATVSLRELDLSSLASVAALGRVLLDEGRPVGILINNAGVMTPPTRQVTTDGFELQFGTNHLGHVALVARLWPLLVAGRARVTSQISVAASRGRINWPDLDWEKSYDAMAAYRQSKIAFGLFAVELQRRSAAAGWGITSTLSQPGVAPTSLLAARTEIGRARPARGRGLISLLSRLGVMGTVASAGESALLAATSPAAAGARLFGPSGLGHLAGRPAEQKLYTPLTDAAEASRVWTVSAELARVSFPNSA